MAKVYHYLGSAEVNVGHTDRQRVDRPRDIQDWTVRTRKEIRDHSVTATFIISQTGELWIADRRSEHVACARDEPVQSAGEMTFLICP